MEPKQGFATAVGAEPEPGQQPDQEQSAAPGTESKQGMATGVAAPTA